jgi:hypothetical protein
LSIANANRHSTINPPPREPSIGNRHYNRQSPIGNRQSASLTTIHRPAAAIRRNPAAAAAILS